MFFRPLVALNGTLAIDAEVLVVVLGDFLGDRDFGARVDAADLEEMKR